MSNTATFTFAADPDRVAVAKSEIRRASGMSIVGESEAGGRTTLIIRIDDVWPESRLDAAQQVLAGFVTGLERA